MKQYFVKNLFLNKFNNRLYLILLFLLNPTFSLPAACLPDIPSLLTSAPMDIARVNQIIPLGNLNPSGNHTIPVDHMYIEFDDPNGDGTVHYPIHNMADGHLFMLFRQQIPNRPDYDYQIFIKHTCSIYSYFDHLHGLNIVISNYLTANGVAWLDISGTGAGPWIITLGQIGGPALLHLLSGQKIGVAKNYSNSLDIGLVDTRQLNEIFANLNNTRYPTYNDIAANYPALNTIDFSIYTMDGKTINAACFIDYMDDSSGMQSDWFDKLSSIPKNCGSVGWDTVGQLRGVWFNPEIDVIGSPVTDYDSAALSIVPDNQNPNSRIQIGFGNAVNSNNVINLALIDPESSDPLAITPQVKLPFFITVDNTEFAVINPEPSTVGIGITVCYDLPYYELNAVVHSYNTILFNMSDATHLSIKYDPTMQVSPQCSNIVATAVVDLTWVEYVR